MMILGVDYHPSFQQIAFFIEETGECGERRLNHEDGEAERFYRELKLKGISVRVGMEATGYSRWFERLLARRRSGWKVRARRPSWQPWARRRRNPPTLTPRGAMPWWRR